MGLRNQEVPASSSHSLHSLDDAPPPYSDDLESFPVPPVPPAPNQRHIEPLRLIDSAYVLPGGTDIRPYDKIALTLAPNLSTNSDELFQALKKQIKLPLRPLFYVKGSHTESSNNGKKDKNSNTVTDFEFKLDLAETMLTGWEGRPMAINWMEVEIVTDEDQKPAYRGGIWRSRTYKPPKTRQAIALGDDTNALLGEDANADGSLNKLQSALKLWCERFCQDAAPVKSFTLHRQLNGFNSNALRNVLSSHIRELNYRGSLDFSFSTAHSSVTIYSPHWINRVRANRYAWWIIVILQLWIITWPIIFFMEKRYEVAHVKWHASLVPETESALIKCYAQGRDESALGEYWAPAVKQAAWSRRRGGGDVLTRMDAERVQGYSMQQLLGMRTDTSDSERERRERVSNGTGGFVDNVVGLVRGVSEAGQDWRMSMGWGANS
ncbi:uncharacterized protein N7511_008151 [Penicillium nucicola]|uniref:uncharacterized protein n=1 Tax=Penicillium nucicola TaxID=1850975 RepID=UPI0025457CD5|nr:uncharacterized protein N7511_008151 [Penicillium nucicola]KAJ5753998.1 hypothetical protein N7511_008151 [Penicillium nucicola]